MPTYGLGGAQEPCFTNHPTCEFEFVQVLLNLPHLCPCPVSALPLGCPSLLEDRDLLLEKGRGQRRKRTLQKAAARQ